MYQQNKQLEGLVRPVIDALGYQLWGLEYLGNGKNTILRIYIDSDDGIRVEDCEKVSKQVVGVLDVEDPIPGAYQLEVSSPGLDRLLFSVEQFQRFTGEQVKLRLNRKIDGRRRYVGSIKSVNNDYIEIMTDDEIHRLPIDAIEMARLVPEIKRDKR